MISVALARRIHTAGVAWHPAAGDRFALLATELVGEVFTVSEMVVEAREHTTGTILAFNGTTEWALDSVALDDTLWLPREDQLREILGGAFRTLTRSPTGEFGVVAAIPGRPERSFSSTNPADAYAQAVLALVDAARR